MPQTWAYDLNNEKLMDDFRKATAQAGVSNSGLVIDFMSGYQATEALYLYGVVMSRLDSKRPPFKPGDKVRMCPKETYYCGSVNHQEHASGEAKPDTEYDVWRVWYEKTRRPAYLGGEHFDWTISFKTKEDSGWQHYRFPASRFEKIEQVQPATA